MPVTEQQISDLKAAISAKLADFGKKYSMGTEMRSASTSQHLIVQTAISNYWETAAILELASGRFLKGTYNPRKRQLTVHAKQPKTAPTIDSYQLDGFGNVKGIPNKRIVVIGATCEPGGQISHSPN